MDTDVASGPPPGLDAVFLDRDGTLTVPPSDRYVLRPEELWLLSGAGEAVAELNRRGVEVHVVTNQRCIALGLLDADGLTRMHDRLRELLSASGATIDSLQVCPHDVGECECRKPADGMLRRVLRERPYLRPQHCAVIGDAPTDVRAGQGLGVWTILLRGAAAEARSDVEADWVADDVLEAVQRLLTATTPHDNPSQEAHSAVTCAVDDMAGG